MIVTMTEQELNRIDQTEEPAAESPAEKAAETGLEEKQTETESCNQVPAPEQEEQTTAGLPEQKKQKPAGFGAVATFWLMVLYDFPGIGLIASALAGFIFVKTRAHRSLAKACFARGVIVLLIVGMLVGGYFFLRSRFALSNFLERLLQDALNFVRSNHDKL